MAPKRKRPRHKQVEDAKPPQSAPFSPRVSDYDRILCDTGILLALADRKQRDHQQVRALLQSRLKQTATLKLLTTWPCFTETMYLAQRHGGWPLQSQVAQLIYQDIIEIRCPVVDEENYDRLFALMEQYQNVPMDLADATLVLMAEATGLREILTLDSDFQIYRVHQHETFEILP